MELWWFAVDTESWPKHPGVSRNVDAFYCSEESARRAMKVVARTRHFDISKITLYNGTIEWKQA